MTYICPPSSPLFPFFLPAFTSLKRGAINLERIQKKRSTYKRRTCHARRWRGARVLYRKVLTRYKLLPFGAVIPSVRVFVCVRVCVCVCVCQCVCVFVHEAHYYVVCIVHHLSGFKAWFFKNSLILICYCIMI